MLGGILGTGIRFQGRLFWIGDGTYGIGSMKTGGGDEATAQRLCEVRDGGT